MLQNEVVYSISQGAYVMK